MRESKRKRLEAAGWRVSDTQEFLGLTDEEMQYIDLKLRLANKLHEKRKVKHLGQAQLAKLVGSSQSRVAKMECADDTVSLDLLIRSLFALGTTPSELGRIIGR
ncbi:XRE family transcriptional regulator [bacterium]|nr:MAG: XRE family transcriptional regulator [bacterium]